MIARNKNGWCVHEYIDVNENETPRQAAVRELMEETHQQVDELEFKGLFKVSDSQGKIKFQAVFWGEKEELTPFIHDEIDEMENIMLWDLKENIGSAKSIINNGGVLENEILVEGVVEQRYWIEVECANA